MVWIYVRPLSVLFNKLIVRWESTHVSVKLKFNLIFNFIFYNLFVTRLNTYVFVYIKINI